METIRASRPGIRFRPVGASFLATLLIALAAPAVSRAQTMKLLYSFTAGADGEDPIGGLVSDASGNLYGETAFGGAVACSANKRYGCGTVYKFNPKQGLSVLVSFSGPNGASGQSTLTLSGNTLYGTTVIGGASNDGTVFSVHTDGTGFTLLHQFDGADGKQPAGTLQIGTDGTVYGVTFTGGPNKDGVLFSIKPGGTFTILHAFSGGTDGMDPESLQVSKTGVLVGSSVDGGPVEDGCPYGCGTIFEYFPGTGQYHVPFLFGTNGNGGAIGRIGKGPTIYGADTYSVYSIDADLGLVNLGIFNAVEVGGIGSGPVLTKSGALIGVVGAGPIQGSGYLYSVPSNAVNGTVTIIAGFGGSIGAVPQGQPLVRPKGAIIGTASTQGLCSACGTIWEYLP